MDPLTHRPAWHLALNCLIFTGSPFLRVQMRLWEKQDPPPSPTLFVFLRREDIVIWGNAIELPKVHENWPQK